MKLIRIFGSKKKKTVLIIQCRLSSTRLPGKALKPLGDKVVLEWVLAAMKKVHCDDYYLATDEESAPQLAPYAEKWGYKLHAGPREDVLERFCQVIEASHADIVVRATADNPFLFYEAASFLLDEYIKRDLSSPVDYITFTGLPHGSGVEIFNGASLLKAKELTDLPYDHEHVGPSLYNHKENFNCEFLKAPRRFNFPELRTTIDTPQDYRRALGIVKTVSLKDGTTEPYTTEQIVSALGADSIKNPIILFPCTKKGRGTGHLRRMLGLAIEESCDIYISPGSDLEQVDSIVKLYLEKGLQEWQIVSELTDVGSYSLAVFDSFRSDEKLLKEVSAKCSVCCIDEGSKDTDCADFLLDILPSLEQNSNVNLSDPFLLSLPSKHHESPVEREEIRKVLVVFGGEDPANLSIPCAKSLLTIGFEVTAVSPKADLLSQEETFGEAKITWVKNIPELKEHLYEFDLVVTHYGFTAFEAISAGCAVILVATTDLHGNLSEKYGFASLSKDSISPENFIEILKTKEILSSNSRFNEIGEGVTKSNLASFIKLLSKGKSIPCPVCRDTSKEENSKNILVARTPHRTFRRCRTCGMLYMSWNIDFEETVYDHAYFYEDYQKQYGKTYVDDFDSIKAQCLRRVSNIDQLYAHFRSTVTPTILDIGCAMGPFLDAANDSGWQVYGTDISSDAVDYVQNNLHYPAVCASFPNFDPLAEFGMEKFDAVTMWYVIEHFQDLDSVLKTVSNIVKKGGIFAFSTPSASGVSAKYNSAEFFTSSPKDHFTLWEPKRADSILRKYGFKVEKIVSTGIHPERFPSVKRHGWGEKSFQYNAVKAFGKVSKLGDTFEVYCKKI